MTDKEREFDVTELDENELEDVSGGMAGLDAWCKDNTTCPTNSGNCVAGCACPPSGT